jgi:hypothetical protein
VTAKNDAIARRFADQSARGSSTTSTADLVAVPPWAISARNSSSTAPAHGQISGLIDVGPRGPPVSRSTSSSLRASRGSAGASDKDRHHRRRDVASHFDGLAKGEPRVSSMVPIPTEADEEARRAYRE